MAYYGKLPNFHKAWLRSLRNNETIDFVIISDLFSNLSLPNNVKVLPISFTEFKEIIQNHFNCNISLNDYGRISQFRSAFGDIYNTEIKITIFGDILNVI